jgi:lipoate-protein ligase A
MTKTQWRLLPLLEAAGAQQMAIDRWLLQQHRQGNCPPTLRFYTWSPAAISLGYHQRDYPRHWRDLTWQGQPLDIVRRPTGGRAVLHQGDLTYAVVTSGIKGTRIEVYEKICQFLREGWRSLGVELDYGSGGRGYIHSPNCFATATGADLVGADGNKLIGSAQLRQGEAILQHGSILISPDRQLFQQVFGDFNPFIPAGEQPDLLTRAIAALTDAAGRCFKTELVSQPLSAAEWQSIIPNPVDKTH